MKYSNHKKQSSQFDQSSEEVGGRPSQDSLVDGANRSKQTNQSGRKCCAIKWLIPFALLCVSLACFFAVITSDQPDPDPESSASTSPSEWENPAESTAFPIESRPKDNMDPTETIQETTMPEPAQTIVETAVPKKICFSRDLVLKNFDPSGQSAMAFGSNIRKNHISSIEFLDSLAYAPESSLDVSETGNRKVLLWDELDGNGMRKLYIAGDGKVYFPEDSSFLFGGVYSSDYAGCFSMLKKIHFGGAADTSRVQNMSAMFQFCVRMENIDLNGFSTENVTDMSYMFCGCGGLESLDVSTFCTDNVTSMSTMFSKCWCLRSLDLSNFATENVTNMVWMFGHCSALSELNLGAFDTVNIRDMGCMFRNSNRNLKIITENQGIYSQFKRDLQ